MQRIFTEQYLDFVATSSWNRVSGFPWVSEYVRSRSQSRSLTFPWCGNFGYVTRKPHIMIVIAIC